MPNIDDLIGTALDQQPTRFASVFNDIMGQKATEAIDAMRTSVAQGIYASEEDLEPEDQDDTEDDLEDLEDIDDDEFDDVDDLDLEDEDLQFDDQDLEGFEDDGEDA
jgi:hypothetical protein